jgi:hypothetical protein
MPGAVDGDGYICHGCISQFVMIYKSIIHGLKRNGDDVEYY